MMEVSLPSAVVFDGALARSGFTENSLIICLPHQLIGSLAALGIEPLTMGRGPVKRPPLYVPAFLLSV